MTRLSVNVNKLATLRNARGKNLPDVAQLSGKILQYGAHGITVHPRPDGRHIRTMDVLNLHDVVKKWNQSHKAHAEFNIEGYPAREFLDLVRQVKPDQCTLVPDPPEALTSNAGWDLAANADFLLGVLGELKEQGIRVSLFVDPAGFAGPQLSALTRLKPDRIELYTEAYADHFGTDKQNQITELYSRASEYALSHGIGVNAGHDLNQQNLGFLTAQIPRLAEVSIGHALICEALEQGLEVTIRNYLKILGHD